MRRTLALTTALAALGALALPAGAHNDGLPAVPISARNIVHQNNVPDLVGNNLAFFERLEDDGTINRYVVAGTVGNGFDIVNVNDPTHPTTVGRYLLGDGDGLAPVQTSSAGVNYHAWVDVNPEANIVALTVENPAGVTVRHNGFTGIQFVDISDVTNPVPLGKVDGLEGPHTVRMVGDHCAYTSLNTYVVDYSDPMNPEATFLPTMQIHEIFEDPNIPGRAYVGTAVSGKWAVWDVSDCTNPRVITEHSNPGALDTAHEVYPSPDSSYVGVADFTIEGQAQTGCPGGGIHFYDISGKHVPGATLHNPKKMGVYFAPFEGTSPQTLQVGTQEINHASCTMHSWQMNFEREIGLGGLYTGGTWVLDSTGPPNPDGDYVEYDGPIGTTTWGNTVANNRDALDFVNATQWYPFDTDNPEWEKLIFTVGWERGLDVYAYTGPWPNKMSRITIDAQASGGAVTGSLHRYGILTHSGFENLPLEGKTLTVASAGSSVQVTTGADGSWSADLGLGGGSHEVTVSWPGDDVFQQASVTQTVTA